MIKFLFITLFLAMAAELCTAIQLKPRDSIHADDQERYDKFMSRVQDNEYVDMYPENKSVLVNIRDDPSNEIVDSSTFKPSDVSTQYFQQMNALADQLMPVPETTETEKATDKEKRAAECPKVKREVNVLEARVSRCRQFCGSIAHCRGNNGCPHCHAVRQNCPHQKWCV